MVAPASTISADTTCRCPYSFGFRGTLFPPEKRILMTIPIIYGGDLVNANGK